MRQLRPVLALVTAVAALALAGCTTESQVCKDGVCKISMSGKGATAKLGGEGGSTIELISASGKQAKVKIGSQTGTLVLNEPIDLNNATLTLVEVKDDKIKLRIDATGGDSGTSPSDAATTPPATS